MPSLLQLVDAQAGARARVEIKVRTRVLALLAGFDGWYDDRLVNEVAGDVAAQVGAGQRLTAGLVDAYLAKTLAEITRSPVDPVGVASDMGRSLRGVPAETVYGRLAEEFRYRRSLDLAGDAALGFVNDRAANMLSADLGLAEVTQISRFTKAKRVSFRRVVHPEMSKGGSCGLCIAVSQRTYYRGDLMPLHSKCKCSVLPVAADQDPGLELNRQDLDALYAAAGSSNRRDLKQIRVQVFEHSELGPQLRVAGQHVKGPPEALAA